MNDRAIIIGMTKDNHYFAMWANDATIYDGATAEEAVICLLTKRYPTIWYVNDKDTPTVTTKSKEFPEGLGTLPSEFINKKTKELKCKYPRIEGEKIEKAMDKLNKESGITVNPFFDRLKKELNLAESKSQHKGGK